MSRPRLRNVLVGVSAVFALAAVTLSAWIEREDTARCPDGLTAQGPRCCGEGQRFEQGACRGPPRRCAWGMQLTPAGCVIRSGRVHIQAGSVLVGPSDWEAQGVVAAREVSVDDFWLDRAEVTEARWQRCATHGLCAQRPPTEPGLPVTQVTLEVSRRFCQAVGGRLPSADEWLFAAMGHEARRFPWGPTGLVCRRAAYGLSAGPCAHGGQGPDLAGARPDGRTPDGVLDLAGNVSEWVEAPQDALAAGGSYESHVAAEVKSWARTVQQGGAPHVGFRCAYDSAD